MPGPVASKDAPAWSVEFFVWLEESLKEKFDGDLPKDVELKLFLSGVTVSVAGEQIAINKLAPRMSREELLSIVTAFIVAYSKHAQYKRPARVPVTAELRARMMGDTSRIVEICQKAGLRVEHTGTCGKAYKGHLVIVQFYAGIPFVAAWACSGSSKWGQYDRVEIDQLETVLCLAYSPVETEQEYIARQCRAAGMFVSTTHDGGFAFLDGARVVEFYGSTVFVASALGWGKHGLGTRGKMQAVTISALPTELKRIVSEAKKLKLSYDRVAPDLEYYLERFHPDILNGYRRFTIGWRWSDRQLEKIRQIKEKSERNETPRSFAFGNWNECPVIDFKELSRHAKHTEIPNYRYEFITLWDAGLAILPLDCTGDVPFDRVPDMSQDDAEQILDWMLEKADSAAECDW